MIPDGSDWFRDYFDERFLQIYRPLLDDERSELEADALREILPLDSHPDLLDVGCGWGRHAIPLAAAGYDVTGVDLSAFLIDEARTLGAARDVDVTWVNRDMRDLPFAGEFDAAISMFSSLGYFGADLEDEHVLRGIAAALRDDGVFVLETMHRDLIAREYADRDWWETPEGIRAWVDRDFDAVAGISHELLLWQAPDGSQGEKEHHIRVRSATEWQTALERCGFAPIGWYGDWDLEPFESTSERLIIVSHLADAD